MKKTIVILLALTLCFTLAVTGFAESDPGPKLETGVIQADGIPAILWWASVRKNAARTLSCGPTSS